MKILVVGDPASIHATRFLMLLKELGHCSHLFNAENYYIQEEHLKHTKIYVNRPLQPPINSNSIECYSPFIHDYNHFASKIFNGIFNRILKNPYTDRNYHKRINHFIQTINAFQPDIILSLKMQNEGYLVAAAKKSGLISRFPPWIHFLWGTDLEYFGKHPDHKTQHFPLILDALNNIDYLIADTNRDLLEATNWGFNGIPLGKIVAPGGFDLNYLNSISQDIEKRNTILVKGRHDGFVGQALIIISALHRHINKIKDKKIVFVMSSQSIYEQVSELREKYQLNCYVAPRMLYDDLLKLYGESRFTISASGVDGTPSFLIESMAMGCLPVHSNLNSVKEWVTDGENGLLFDLNDNERLDSQIDRALSDDSLFHKAQFMNKFICERELNRENIKYRVADLLKFVHSRS